jgi:prepilin peptidase CpaA
MSTAALWDLKTHKIPNLITYPLMLFGVIFHLLNDGLAGVGYSVAGLAIGTAVFIIPYCLGGMGAGDAKLMGATGAVLGMTGALVAAAISAIAGLFYAAFLLLIHHSYRRSFLSRALIMMKTLFLTRQCIPIPPDENEQQPGLCYALPIAMGTFATLFLKISGNNFIQELLGVHFIL